MYFWNPRSLSVQHSTFGRAALLATPLVGLMVSDKAFKLIAVTDSTSGAKHEDFWTYLQAMLAQHNLIVLSVAVSVVGLLLSCLLRRRGGRIGISIGWLLSLVLVYAATVLGSDLHADAEPYDPTIWPAALGELSNLLALWWREGLIATLIVTALSWHFGSAGRPPARLRSIIVGCLLVLGCLVMSIDFGYFIATGVQLTNDDVGYAISAPP